MDKEGNGQSVESEFSVSGQERDHEEYHVEEHGFLETRDRSSRWFSWLMDRGRVRV